MSLVKTSYANLVMDEFGSVVGFAALNDAPMQLLSPDVRDVVRTLSCYLSSMPKLQHLFILVPTLALGGYAVQ